jgi:hypothetical protein
MMLVGVHLQRMSFFLPMLIDHTLFAGATSVARLTVVCELCTAQVRFRFGQAPRASHVLFCSSFRLCQSQCPC